MVAKSFQSAKQLCEPYSVAGKMYVDIELNGKNRRVRWYTEDEYQRMYGEKETKPAFTNQKDALGFQQGYITIFKGDTYAELSWFRQSIARYSKWWGWYVVSTEAVPFDLPCGLEPVRLPWELVGNEDGNLKSDDEVEKAVDALRYDKGNSKFQGQPKDKLELFVTIEKNVALDGYYGRSNSHTMVDKDGNKYIWNTATKDWAVGSVHHIVGTIKELKVIRNEEITVLTRCKELL